MIKRKRRKIRKKIEVARKSNKYFSLVEFHVDIEKKRKSDLLLSLNVYRKDCDHAVSKSFSFY